MPNVMAGLPNIGGALCSMLQSLADAQYSSGMQLRCQDAKPLKLAGVPQTTRSISAASGLKFNICEDMWRRYCCVISFFPVVDMCLICEDMA